MSIMDVRVRPPRGTLRGQHAPLAGRVYSAVQITAIGYPAVMQRALAPLKG